jgi:hypothetical protein
MAAQDRTLDPPKAQAAPASDNPEEDWGEPIQGATYSANHATRGQKPDRSSGPKTRAATKDQISRR